MIPARTNSHPMQTAPVLPTPRRLPLVQNKALLVNPFYAKDPHASYGKHVLTPALTMSSLAGATPEGWELAFWDENLLQGAPPQHELPQVVGITVHLTFARRAREHHIWTRLLLVTFNPGPALEADARDSGADGVINKAEIQDDLEQYLPRWFGCHSR